MAAVAVVVIAGAAWAVWIDREPDFSTHASFYMLEGEVTWINRALTELGFVQVPVEHPEVGRNGYLGFSTADVQWRHATENTWHSGTPECLEHGRDRQPVTLGVFHGFDAEVTNQSHSLLAWLICEVG